MFLFCRVDVQLTRFFQLLNYSCGNKRKTQYTNIRLYHYGVMRWIPLDIVDDLHVILGFMEYAMDTVEG